VRIFQRRERLNRPDAFRPWIFSVARNECISYFRITGRYDPIPDDVADGGDVSNPLATLERVQEAELLASALARLKPYYREVIILRDYQGLSYVEIGDIIGEPERVVKSRLFTARRRMYDFLKPYVLERT
jgi:RNA polymerase sigma-70 factor (ECF subfamily)